MGMKYTHVFYINLWSSFVQNWRLGIVVNVAVSTAIWLSPWHHWYRLLTSSEECQCLHTTKQLECASMQNELWLNAPQPEPGCREDYSCGRLLRPRVRKRMWTVASSDWDTGCRCDCSSHIANMPDEKTSCKYNNVCRLAQENTPCWVPQYCMSLLLSVIYMPTFSALGLIISNNIATQLVWLQTYHSYRKYRTDEHSIIITVTLTIASNHFAWKQVQALCIKDTRDNLSGIFLHTGWANMAVPWRAINLLHKYYCYHTKPDQENIFLYNFRPICILASIPL